MTTITLDRLHNPDPRWTGIALGTAAAAMWASYLVFAESGIAEGLAPQDIILLRYGVAGLVILPWLLTHDPGHLAGVGWTRGLILAAIAGPLFILLGASGYLFAPLSHGAVIQPSAIILGGMAAAALALGERFTRAKGIGALVIILGLVVTAGLFGAEEARPSAWIGDAMFFGAGLLWAAFTVLLKRWGIGGLPATAVVSVLSAAVVLPAFAMFGSFERLLALSPATLATQIVVQGLMAGLIAVIAYGAAVGRLGAGRAALFPALVPALALVLGILVTGVGPEVSDIAGAILATTGLLIALGLIPLRAQ